MTSLVEAMEPSVAFDYSTQGQLHELNLSGDTTLTWTRGNEVEEAAARAHFDAMTAKGYTAWRVAADGLAHGSKMRTFDPAAEKVILAPPIVGG